MRCPPFANLFASADPAAIGALSLGLPMLAWGLLGVCVPVFIHLVFRERAQTQAFPALRFLLQVHSPATRSQTLRHLLLLLVRMAVLALAVGALGRFGCTREGGPSPIPAVAAATPASVVFCIDNSASMGYRYQGQTRVQAAVNRARSLLDDGRLFGPGSQFAVVSGTTSPGMSAWREDRQATGRLLDTIRPAAHSLSAAHLLGRAYGMLSNARHVRREVYFFNDLSESSWRESPPPAPASLTALYVMDVGQNENRNAALSWPQVPPHELPAGAPASIPIRIINGDLPIEPVLEFSIDGKPRGRQAPGPLAANSQIEVILDLPALDAGPHSLQVTLEPGDALAFDNTRYAWLMGGALPLVGLVRADGNNEVALMLQAMIAPPHLPPSEQRYTLEPIPIESLLARNLDDMIAVVLADLKGLNGLAWERLGKYVRAGGVLIVVPGPSLSPPDYEAGRDILPATIESLVDCDPPLRPAAANLSHAYLQPFADLTIDSVNDRHAFKRLAATPAKTATVVFPFADGSPALLESPIGKGRTILLTFSPAADWGQFGTQAAPLLVLLHRILETARPALENVISLTAGPPRLRPVGDGSPILLVRSQANTEQTVMPSPTRLYPLPAELPQLYTAAEKSNPSKIRLYYSVNVAEAESHPGRLSGDEIKTRCEGVPLRVAGPADPILPGAGSGPDRVNWSVPLGIAAILLLVIESSFSNRFYRSNGRKIA